MICASAPAIRPLIGTLKSRNATYNRSSSSASGAPARRSHHIALQTFGGSSRRLEPGSKSAVGCSTAAASESGEHIVLSGDGEGGGSTDEVKSLDMAAERIEVVGDGRLSESSRDLEYGR